MNPWGRKPTVHIFFGKEDEKMKRELVDEWKCGDPPVRWCECSPPLLKMNFNVN